MRGSWGRSEEVVFLWREGWWWPTYLVEAQHGYPDGRRLFPAVLDALQVAVEEFLQVFGGRGRVQVVPLLRGVDAQPLFGAGGIVVGLHGAEPMDR